MAARASILQSYKEASLAERLDIICKNYTDFLSIIEYFTETLLYMIENEKLQNRRAKQGELGVRVQGGRLHGDVTADTAIRHVEIEEAIISCDFSGDVLEDVDHSKEFQERANVLKSMREDYDMFNRQLILLGRKELKVFQCYLTGEKNLNDLADAEGISYKSVIQKVRRAKIKIRIQMEDVLEGIA